MDLTSTMRRLVSAGLLGLGCLSCIQLPAATIVPGEFSIPELPLADALDRFSEQSGLQLIYRPGIITSEHGPALYGRVTPEAALDLLLQDSGLNWRYLDTRTIVLTPTVTRDPGSAPITASEAIAYQGIEDMQVIGKKPRPYGYESGSSLFGRSASLFEIPRSVSVIDADWIAKAGLYSMDDLLRFVPGVYTPSRFGIQGAISLRNESADTYFRGMKRINLEGHTRTLPGATGALEIVRGPPPTIYGMGKTGGYTNIIPRAERASVIAYTRQREGYLEMGLGTFDQRRWSAGSGGPLTLGGRPGGYYINGLIENSGDYSRHINVRHRFAQASVSLHELPGGWRMETGFDFQGTETAGSLLNRVNRSLIEEGRYLGGSPLVNLDLNDNGSIGFYEMHEGSPVRGEIAAGNQPLIQYWEWPRDAQGSPLPLEEFPVLAGIPESLHDYLDQHPEADPEGALRARGIGGPLPVSGYVPAGFALDPRQVEFLEMDFRRSAAYERKIHANLGLGWLDLVHDNDPDRTLRNQLFIDNMDQYKISGQPGGGRQDVTVVEDRFTLGYRFNALPEWMDLHLTAAFNIRHTRASGYRYGGDQGSHRTDAMRNDGAMTSNTTFVHAFENNDIDQDGAPWFVDYRTRTLDAGAGLLLDMVLHDDYRLLAGMRLDYSHAKNVDRAGTYNHLVGSSDMPGKWRDTDSRTAASDHVHSWQVSLSRTWPAGITPYITAAYSGTVLETSNHRISNAVIEAGHLGRSRLLEAGIRFSLLDDRLQWFIQGYEQTRPELDDDAAQLPQELIATKTRGIETEFRWYPTTEMLIGGYALTQQTRFRNQPGAAILVDARTLGFKDVRDVEGHVIYPAEAFLYGGRSFLLLPEGMEAYGKRQGLPDFQSGLYAYYESIGGTGVMAGMNYFSATYSGRLKQVRLPAVLLVNAGVMHDTGNWVFRFDINNLFDRHYFRARSGDSLGETLVSAMPGRQLRLTIAYRY